MLSTYHKHLYLFIFLINIFQLEIKFTLAIKFFIIFIWLSKSTKEKKNIKKNDFHIFEFIMEKIKGY